MQKQTPSLKHYHYQESSTQVIYIGIADMDNTYHYLKPGRNVSQTFVGPTSRIF